MRKTIIVALVAGLLVGGLLAPAEAKKKKKPKPTPVATTLFAHGSQPFGEVEIATNISDGTFMVMDATEPTGAQPKSMQILNYAGGPNTNCAGNALFPVWVGDAAGTVTGDMKFSFQVASLASQAVVRVWADISSQACNDAYVPAQREVTVDLPSSPGTMVEAVLSGADFPVGAKLMVQISPILPSQSNGRVFYDGAGALTKLEFSCIPASGTTCTP